MNLFADESVDRQIVDVVSQAIFEHVNEITGAFAVITSGIIRVRRSFS